MLGELFNDISHVRMHIFLISDSFFLEEKLKSCLNSVNVIEKINHQPESAVTLLTLLMTCVMNKAKFAFSYKFEASSSLLGISAVLLLL